ncbi:MAG: RNA polymerase sigma factor [Vicinamibacterales bacterium]
MTDEVLMLAVRDGDLTQLGPLFERHHVALFDFLSRMTGDRAAAEDLVQDVFLRVLKYRSTYRDGGCFETWLFRIARNLRADYFRRRPAATALPDDVLDRPDGFAGPAHQLELARNHARLRKALALLRDDQRELIVLARFRAMKHEQIAEILGVDVGVVKVRLHRAIRELRDVFVRLPDERSLWNVQKSTSGLPTI